MIITRSPLRISLGGGGTDLPSYYREHGGFLIAGAIDKYVYITLHEPFVDQITFIHCEIYVDLSGQKSTTPVLSYHLEHEPLLLLAGTDGIVRTRIDNAFDQVEAADALRQLAAS